MCYDQIHPLTSHLHPPPPTQLHLLLLFLIISPNLCCSYIFRCEAFHWSVVHLPGDILFFFFFKLPLFSMCVKSVLYFSNMVPGTQTQVTRLGGKYLSPPATPRAQGDHTLRENGLSQQLAVFNSSSATGGTHS